MHTKTVGEISEAAVLSALLKLGKTVLLPFGENHRFDLATDSGDGKISRIQVKTGRMKNGAVVFPTASTSQGRKGYEGQADSFGIYVPDINKTYLVPVSCVGKTCGHLRIDPTLNKQKKRVREAKDFEI